MEGYRPVLFFRVATKKIQTIAAGLFMSLITIFRRDKTWILDQKRACFVDTNLQLFQVIEYPEKKCLCLQRKITAFLLDS
jgi:hypothetical protein